ncbi:hypothetical protein [Streptosporangium roseum]|uniref:hypothetical protein n=1 Tax=Streptosporangium roseum TaxID=2001 RepID=UPI0033318B86
MNPRVFSFHEVFRPLGSATGGVLFLGQRGEEGAGVLGVADGGLGVQAEDGGEVEGIGAVSEGLFELPVDAQAFEGRGLAAQLRFGEVDDADTGVAGCGRCRTPPPAARGLPIFQQD